MSSLPLMQNPIHTIMISVPDFVWRHYEGRVKEVIIEDSPAAGSAQSFRVSWRNYYTGKTSASAMATFHRKLQEMILKVLPIENKEAFFGGSLQDMDTEARATATRMIRDYEAAYAAQKKALVC